MICFVVKETYKALLATESVAHLLYTVVEVLFVIVHHEKTRNIGHFLINEMT